MLVANGDGKFLHHILPQYLVGAIRPHFFRLELEPASSWPSHGRDGHWDLASRVQMEYNLHSGQLACVSEYSEYFFYLPLWIEREPTVPIWRRMHPDGTIRPAWLERCRFSNRMPPFGKEAEEFSRATSSIIFLEVSWCTQLFSESMHWSFVRANMMQKGYIFLYKSWKKNDGQSKNIYRDECKVTSWYTRWLRNVWRSVRCRK